MSEALEGRLALVSGGSRGIGRQIAVELARAGARVLLSSRTADAARRTAAEIDSEGKRVHGIELDVGDDESTGRVTRTLLAEHGGVSILVNNAGITRDGLLLRMKKEDWTAVLDTNLGGVYRLCRGLLPSMVRGRWGRIVNITSVVAAAGNPGQANYAAAKAGVEGFTRSLAREVASRNVTVNCVAPGFIDTDMTRGLEEGARRRLLEQVPLGRLGRPEDVAAAVLFLVGPGGDYITGTTLEVNGGMYM